MADFVHQFTVTVDQVRDYEFRIRFDKPHLPALIMDEPPPLGGEAGPSASRVLGAAIGNCLSASLLFCARKARVNLGPIHTEVTVRIVRNENKRLRVGSVEVVIDPGIPEEERGQAARCLDLFEDFCTVTQSIRNGIEVDVTVKGLDLPQPADAAPAS